MSDYNVTANKGSKNILELELTNNKTTKYKMPKNVDGYITFIAINHKNKGELAFPQTNLINIEATIKEIHGIQL
ncbi:hypothetical protein GCM10009865_43940 [Aeromicrobium ponti]